MKVNLRQFLLLTLLLLIAILLIPNMQSEPDRTTPVIIHVTFLFTGFFSGYAIMKEGNNAPFSCRTLHWIFIFFFFFLSPYLQYIFNEWPLDYAATDSAIIHANLLVILWCICFHCSRNLLIFHSNLIYRRNDFNNCRTALKERISERERTTGKVVPDSTIFLLMTIAFCLVVFLIFKIGINKLISSRNTSSTAYLSDSRASSSFLTAVFRNMISFNAFFNCHRYRVERNRPHLLVISLILLLLGCFPAAIPRFQAATIYLTVFLLLFPKWKYNLYFVIAFILMFIIVFPALSAFRYGNFRNTNIIRLLIRVFQNIQTEYLTANYDAYSMLMKSGDYITEFGYRNGLQLLGVIMFFVPRTIWPSKPVSTGTMIQEAFHAHVSAYNVSSCMIVEAIIDFGIPGIILYAIILSMIFNSIDLRISEPSYADSYDGIIWILLPPLMFFLLRGSLMSVWAFICSYLVIGKCLTLFARKVH